MRPTLFVLTAAMLAAAASSGASAQDMKPGMTTARFYVLNKTPEEAVPVIVTNTNPRTPPVRVETVSTVAAELSEKTMDELERQHGLPQPVTVKSQPWEYRDAVLDANDNRVSTLNALGAAGWEAIGMSQVDGKTVILLKRPK